MCWYAEPFPQILSPLRLHKLAEGVGGDALGSLAARDVELEMPSQSARNNFEDGSAITCLRYSASAGDFKAIKVWTILLRITPKLLHRTSNFTTGIYNDGSSL
jgi:hypothetical protein